MRKDVNIYLFDPTRKYFHIVLELENVPGALRNVLEVMHGLNLNILGSFSSVDASAQVGVWSGFVEDSEHSSWDLKQKLMVSPYVHDAMVVESSKGFLVDGVHFPLAYNTGTRAIMMGAKPLANMLSTVNEQFGSGGNVILYEEGLSYGKETGSEYMAKLGADFIVPNITEVLKLYQALGWFKIGKAHFEAPEWTLTVQAEENFECMGVDSRVPHSHFVRGHLEGVVITWLGRPMECRETLCVAKGDKVCEFVVAPRPS